MSIVKTLSKTIKMAVSRNPDFSIEKGVYMLNLLTDYIENTPQKMISYADYIQQALYHSEYGYYMKDKEKIGPGEILLQPAMFLIYMEGPFQSGFIKWQGNISCLFRSVK